MLSKQLCLFFFHLYVLSICVVILYVLFIAQTSTTVRGAIGAYVKTKEGICSVNVKSEGTVVKRDEHNDKNENVDVQSKDTKNTVAPISSLPV